MKHRGITFILPVTYYDYRRGPNKQNTFVVVLKEWPL